MILDAIEVSIGGLAWRVECWPPLGLHPARLLASLLTGSLGQQQTDIPYGDGFNVANVAARLYDKLAEGVPGYLVDKLDRQRFGELCFQLYKDAWRNAAQQTGQESAALAGQSEE